MVLQILSIKKTFKHIKSRTTRDLLGHVERSKDYASIMIILAQEGAKILKVTLNKEMGGHAIFESKTTRHCTPRKKMLKSKDMRTLKLLVSNIASLFFCYYNCR